MEIEPSGTVWIVLDLNEAVQSGKDETSTLEFGVILAASLAAELLIGTERRAVGLLTVSGKNPTTSSSATNNHELTATSDTFLLQAAIPNLQSPIVMSSAKQAVLVSSQPGQAQLWRILGALAAVQATDVPLAELLRNSGSRVGRRGTVIVITPQVRNFEGADDWTAELLHLQALGAASSVLLVTETGASDDAGEPLGALLARYDIPLQTWRAGTRLPAALTFRRTRKIVRNTPTGGAVTYEVDEDVG
jgi:hypothetical protein